MNGCLSHLNLKVLDISNCKWADFEFLKTVPNTIEALNLTGSPKLANFELISEWNNSHFKNLSIFLPSITVFSFTLNDIKMDDELDGKIVYLAPSFCSFCKKSQFLEKFFCFCCLSCGSPLHYKKIIVEDKPNHNKNLSPKSFVPGKVFPKRKRRFFQRNENK